MHIYIHIFCVYIYIYMGPWSSCAIGIIIHELLAVAVGAQAAVLQQLIHTSAKNNCLVVGVLVVADED